MDGAASFPPGREDSATVAGDGAWVEASLATYNLHRWVGLDRRYDPERSADVAAELNADILGLQEIDARKLKRHGQEPMELLARRLNAHVVLGSLLRGPKGPMRCGLVTKATVLAQRDLNLNPPGAEPRGAVDVDLAWRGATLRVIVAHLGLRLRERKRQVARLMAALADQGDRPVVIMGDFNEWRALRASLQPLDAQFSAASTPVPTFPTRLPLLALDRIWLGGGEAQLSGQRVHRSPLARRASDHLPLCAVGRWRSRAALHDVDQ